MIDEPRENLLTILILVGSVVTMGYLMFISATNIMSNSPPPPQFEKGDLVRIKTNGCEGRIVNCSWSSSRGYIYTVRIVDPDKLSWYTVRLQESQLDRVTKWTTEQTTQQE